MKLNDHQLIYELRHWETSTAMFGSLAEAAANVIERLIKERADLYVAIDEASVTNGERT